MEEIKQDVIENKVNIWLSSKNFEDEVNIDLVVCNEYKDERNHEDDNGSDVNNKSNLISLLLMNNHDN